MRVYHPNAVRETTDNVDGRVDIDGDLYEVTDDDTLDVPERRGEKLAARYGLDLAAIRVEETPATCEVVKSDGEVCGRERPCRYHDE